jgi:serine/threonine protein kinase
MALLQNVANEYAGKNGYTMVNFIGNGAFKEVYRISMKDGITRVLKLSDASKCNVDRTEREISSLLKCNDPRIARVYEHGIFDYNRGKYIYFIEEYLDGGILTAKMASNKIPIETILTDGKEMVKALAHLKELNLVHRDIKPDNIMFRKEINQPVFTDLGLVRDLKNISLTPSRVLFST